MPELPEVETVKNTLKNHILNKQIKDILINYPNIIEYPTTNLFKERLINQSIVDIKRRGKWLMFELNDYYLLSHLRMEGRYYLKNNDDPIDKHEHISFVFTDNSCLRYKDTRKFGRMYLYDKDEVYNRKPLNLLGLEPWSDKLTISYLKQQYKNKKIPIKTVILDQNIIVGIGNIYADEILFLSKINPLLLANTLKDSDLNNIILYTRQVLNAAILEGGTTIKSYESSEGVHGRFQNSLLVHGLDKHKCKNCNNEIIKIKINGRGTYYCPNCQK